MKIDDADEPQIYLKIVNGPCVHYSQNFVRMKVLVHRCVSGNVVVSSCMGALDFRMSIIIE